MNINCMKPSRIKQLIAYFFMISLAYINGGCGNANDPTPAVTPTTPGTVMPTLVDGAAIQFTQVETGLDSENETNRMEPQFNNLGQLISLTNNHQSNYTTNSILKCTLTYTSDGFLSGRKITYDYAASTSLSQYVSTEKFDYQNGKLSKVELTKNRDDNYEIVSPFTITKYYQYDASGKLTQYKQIDQNGSETEREDYGYDANNKISSYKEYQKGVLGNVEYVFANGFVVKRTVKYQGKVNFINDYLYDSNGQNIRYTTTNAIGATSFWTITYDDKKVPLDFASNFFIDFGSGLGFDYLLFKGHPASPFNTGVASHNVLSITDSNPLGRQYNYKYQYNSQGYPTEATYSVYNGTKKDTINGKRTYTYFK